MAGLQTRVFLLLFVFLFPFPSFARFPRHVLVSRQASSESVPQLSCLCPSHSLTSNHRYKIISPYQSSPQNCSPTGAPGCPQNLRLSCLCALRLCQLNGVFASATLPAPFPGFPSFPIVFYLAASGILSRQQRAALLTLFSATSGKIRRQLKRGTSIAHILDYEGQRRTKWRNTKKVTTSNSK